MADIRPEIAVPPLDVHEDPQTYSECLRVARWLRKRGRRTIGLWPAGPSVAVPPLAMQFGRALARLAGEPVALIDANVRYPAFPVGESGGGESSGAKEAMFVDRRLDDSLVLISPRWVGAAGAGVPQLAMLIERRRDDFAHLLVDLTGFDQLGDHLAAAALLDGVVLVARVGASKDAELLKMKAALPPEANLGVMLTG